MSLYFALQTVENNKHKKSVKFQGDMLNFCDFIQVFVYTTNHHLNCWKMSNAKLSLRWSITVKTLKIGTPRLTIVAVFNIKQYDFTMQ